MYYVKIHDVLYPATINGSLQDRAWDNRDSKTIKLEMTHAEAAATFVDGLAWSIVHQFEVPVYQKDENDEYVLDENGNPIQTGTEMQETEYDNSDYCVAGDITDHRDGTLSIKMGKPTQIEQLEEENAALLFENLTGEVL